jgi:hypothetical protein
VKFFKNFQKYSIQAFDKVAEFLYYDSPINGAINYLNLIVSKKEYLKKN